MSKPNFEFLDALGQIARDKGISVETLLDALANALVAAYKRMPDSAEEAVVTIDPDSGEIRVYGQELDEDGNVLREWDDTPDDFGRIAAQTAKQVILQRIREVERDLKYEEYAGREGDIVTGIVQQTDNRYTLLDLGKVEALLPQAEQVSYERYEHGVPRSWSVAAILASSSDSLNLKCPRSPRVLWRSRPPLESPATAPRSPCGRTTRT
jgi:N utilization substance protein A